MQRKDVSRERSEADAGKTVSTIARKIISAALTIALAACILLMLYWAISGRNENGITVGSYGLASILTGSMEPEIQTGSLIIIKSVPEDQLMTGDVITYRPIEGRSILVTHRIVNKNSEDNSFITQGDANNIPDSDPVYFGSIAGKVIFTIPFLGYLVNYLKTPQGIIIFVLFIVLCEIIWRLIPKRKSNKIYKGENNL